MEALRSEPEQAAAGAPQQDPPVGFHIVFRMNTPPYTILRGLCIPVWTSCVLTAMRVTVNDWCTGYKRISIGFRVYRVYGAHAR